MKYSFIFWWFVFVLLAGCAENIGEQTPEYAATLTLLPSSTVTSSSIATATLASTSETFLSERIPTIEQVETYLTEFVSTNLYYDKNREAECRRLQEFPCVLSSEYLYYVPELQGPAGIASSPEEYIIDFVHYALSRPFTELLYEDVNGDDENDLVVSADAVVIIFLWQKSHYSRPFIVLYRPWKYGGASRVYFEDWTVDGISEIIFDFRGDSGGPGILTQTWFRHIIHCSEEDCQVVWTGSPANIFDNAVSNGIDFSNSSVQLNTEVSGQPTLEEESHQFEVFSYTGRNFSKNPGYIRVFTSTQSTYLWVNGQFELRNQQIISLPYTITHQSNLTATHRTGKTAFITAEYNGMTLRSDICQLFIEGKQTGPEFGCSQNFTQIDWKDITSDEQEEVVIFTIAGDQVLNGRGGTLISEEDCFNQRLFVYEWNGVQGTKIANVVGCVVQPDLYGAQFEDIDGDGQVEIIAADDWGARDDDGFEFDSFEPIEVDNIYKWNGSEFVFWQKVLR